MLIGLDGRTVGSLSGGCLEEEVAVRALDVLRTGRPALINFDTRARFGCHGEIDIFVEQLRHPFVVALGEHLDARRRCFAETVFTGKHAEQGSRCLSPGDAGRDGAFVQEIIPVRRLIVFGAGPDNVPLRRYGDTLGWEMIEAEQASELPREADEWTAAIIKSHNYGRDFAALRTLLPLPLTYLGIMGPRRRRDQLLNDVLGGGQSIGAELFAPAGIDLGAETPEEIALAIVAEVQSAFAGGTRVSLRDSKFSIHRAEREQPLYSVMR